MHLYDVEIKLQDVPIFKGLDRATWRSSSRSWSRCPSRKGPCCSRRGMPGTASSSSCFPFPGGNIWGWLPG